MDDVNNQLSGFFNNSIYYGDYDSLFIHKQYWSDLVDEGFAGKVLELSKK